MTTPQSEREIITLLDLEVFAKSAPAPDYNSVMIDVIELDGQRFTRKAVKAALEAASQGAQDALLKYPGLIAAHNNVHGYPSAGGEYPIDWIVDFALKD